MTEPHTDDQDLERHILLVDGREELPPDPHVAGCDRCAERYRFLRRFYAEYRDLLRAGAHPRLLALAEGGVDSHRLVLPPFRARTTVPPAQARLLLHAAQTASETRYASVATFALASTGVLARVVRDHESGLYRISVLAEDPEHRRHVLVGVGGPDGQSPLSPTDRDGLAVMSLASEADWSTMYAVVITPCASIVLPTGLPLSGTVSGGSMSVVITSHNGSLCLAISAHPGERVGHTVVVLRDGSAILRPVVDNSCSFEPAVAPEATELRFFV